MRARFDIVFFDPRGFGFSTAVRCFPTVAAEQKFLSALPLFPIGAKQDAQWEQTWARFDARCAKTNGALLDHDTSADVARDMDLLRAAVGDPVLNYLGVSYGTGLGAIYANLFPARVGRMILDANLDPVAWTTPDGNLPYPLRLGFDEANAADMTAFLNLCGQAARAACAFPAGHPGGDPRQMAHAAAPPDRASGYHRQPATDVHLRRRIRGGGPGRRLRLAAGGRPAAAPLESLGNGPSHPGRLPHRGHSRHRTCLHGLRADIGRAVLRWP